MFEFIMESKIEKCQGESLKANTVLSKSIKDAFGKSFEQDLMEDIENLILKAAKQKDKTKRAALVKKARGIETLLLISFANQGQHLMAQGMANKFEKFRLENLG